MGRNKEVKSSKVFSSFIFGALVGAAAALFLTPKSGIEIRGNLNRQTISLKKKGSDFASKAKEKSSHFAKSVSDSGVIHKVKGRSLKQNGRTLEKNSANSSAFPKDYDTTSHDSGKEN